MKKLFTLMFVALYSFTAYAQDPGSIKTNDQDKVYSDESFGQIKQVEEATGYGNVYYTWEYGVVGESMIVPTVTYDSGYPYDGDNDGTQDTDANGKLLYYNVTGTFLNVNKVLGTVFGAPKTVTVIRYANDVDGVLGQTSASLDIEVIVEKKLLAGKIATTQDNVRETANIEVITSEEEASEGFGAITYKWSIKKIGSTDAVDLGISTASCDISTKTFADYGMEPGDIVYFNRYATDELGTEVLASKTVKLLSSVAFDASAGKYIVSATIQEKGFNPNFNLINGESINATGTNVGAKLIVANIGSFRRPKYVLAAELAPSMRAPIISDVTYDYVSNEKYNIQYTIDPVSYTYTLAVKHIDSINFVTLAEDQVYYKIDNVSNNVDFTHYEPKNFSVEDFKVISAGSITTNDHDKVYSDESFGQIKQVEAATGYDNVYYTWEYGVVGEDMIVPTVTYDSGYPYDGDNDGTQDTDANGKLLYYNVTGTFLNVNKVLGTVFGAPKTVTVIRYANDVDGVLGQTIASLDIEVIVEKKLLAGKIATTQDNVRETANIEVIISEEEASEGFGAITYKWSIKKIGSTDAVDLGISTASCDISTKTFADYGMEPGDIVYFYRYATDELGTEVLASQTVKLLSSVAFVASTDKPYIVSATIQEKGFNPNFNLINGESINATGTNVGAKLIVANIGSFRRPKYVLAAELAPSMRAPIISDVTYDYVSNEKYNIQYTIDPVSYTYTLAVKHIDSINFVTLAEDQVYYKIGDVSNNVDFTHYEPKNFSVEDFTVKQSAGVALENVPTDAIYKFSATVQGSNRAGLYLFNNPDGFTPYDSRDFSNVGPNLYMTEENSAIFPATKRGISSVLGKTKAIRLNNIMSDVAEVDNISVKFDIEYIIDPINYTYTFRFKKNGESDDTFVTVFENQHFFGKEQDDDSFVYNEFALTHYDTNNLTVENVKITEVTSFPLNIPEADKNYTFTATVTPTSAKNGAFFLRGDDKDGIRNLGDDKTGPSIVFNTNLNIEVFDSNETRMHTKALNVFKWEKNVKYDFKVDVDVSDHTYTFKVKKNGEADDTFVTIVEFQDFYLNTVNGIEYYRTPVLTHYNILSVKVEDALVTMHKSTDAKLSDLTVDEESVTDFDAAILEYDVVLDAGTTTVPTVAGVVNEPNATMAVTDATELPGTTTIVVTAEDGVTQVTYKVNFTVALGMEDISFNGAIFPNPTTGIINLESNHSIEFVEIYNMSGALVKVVETNSKNKVQVNISNLESGVYLVKINADNKVSTTRIVKK